jgi:hypothetical protein
MSASLPDQSDFELLTRVGGGLLSITCFVVPSGQRQSKLTYELAAATVDYG